MTEFLVIGMQGIHSGYWTEELPVPRSEDAIVRAILEEEVEEWECVEDDELAKCVAFVQQIRVKRLRASR